MERYSAIQRPPRTHHRDIDVTTEHLFAMRIEDKTWIYPVILNVAFTNN